MHDSSTNSVVTVNIDGAGDRDSLISSRNDNSVNEPSSPHTLDVNLPATSDMNASILSTIDLPAVKEQRSHERARQRLKKPDDIRKAKRCVRCRYCKPEKWGGNSGRPKENDRVFRGTVMEAEGERKLLLENGAESTMDDSGDVTLPRTRSVPLADLIKPPCKRSGKRYEIISRPRQVIAMDDFTEVHDETDVEDWEYVEAGPKHRKTTMSNAPTYAAVVAGA